MTPAGQDEGPEREAVARIPPYLGAQLSFGAAGPPEEEPAGTHAQLRPFVLTSGRVQGSPDIGLETQVTARAAWSVPPGRLAPELQTIIALCRDSMSVAEISARAGLHLGVTKVLVSDLEAAGYLDVHTLDASISHQPETILRVIRGLRAIS